MRTIWQRIFESRHERVMRQAREVIEHNERIYGGAPQILFSPEERCALIGWAKIMRSRHENCTMAWLSPEEEAHLAKSLAPLLRELGEGVA